MLVVTQFLTLDYSDVKALSHKVQQIKFKF